MKILMITGTFRPRNFGGITAVSYNLSKSLAALGHDVTVYTTDVGDTKCSRLTLRRARLDNVDVHYFKNVSNSLAFQHHIYTPVGMITNLIRNLPKYDIIHIHDYRSFFNIYINYASKIIKKPFVIQAHGSMPVVVQKENMKYLFDSIFGISLLNNASKLIAVSNAEIYQYRKLVKDASKIELVPNGIEIEKFLNLPGKGFLRNKFGLNGKKIILYFGRIHKRKGIDFLLKSFSLLENERNDVVLIIAGPDDGYRWNIEKYVKNLKLIDKVKFLGYVENPAEVFCDADVLVYPGIYEIFGLVPFEAIMCGTPVIVSNDCGCGEIIISQGIGYSVEYDNYSELKEKMELALMDPQKEDIVKKGKDYIINNLTWGKIAKQIESIYEGCM